MNNENNIKINLNNIQYFGYSEEDFTYEGELKNNLPNGKGILKNKNKNLSQLFFEGIFENGEPISGKLKDIHGNIIEGKFTTFTDDTDHFLEGFGEIIYLNGDVYNGGWYHNEKNGKGKMHYSNGRKFVGEWLDDYPRNGEMLYPNGIRYKGSFDQWTYLFSYGEITYPSGHRFIGSFEYTNTINGSGKIEFPNGMSKNGKVKFVSKKNVNFEKLLWQEP